MDFDYREEEYVKGVASKYQIKYYNGSVKKSTFSFSSYLQIDKKINNAKEDPRSKTDSNFKPFPSAALPSAFEILANKKEFYVVVHILELFLHQKRLK